MKTGYQLQALADYLGASLKGDPAFQIVGLNSLREAGEGEITFLASSAYKRYLSDARAGAVILNEQDAADYTGNVIIAANPYVAYARLSKLFDNRYDIEPGVHPDACVAATARLGCNVAIAANAVIGERVVIGDGSYIGPGTVIGDDTLIGSGCYFHANVTVYHGVSIGSSVIIHSSTVIGGDGFGFANENGRWIKIHQLGGVEIGDNVEIGACTTIDRGALGNTVIGNNVIIDNLVQIAHNVVLGDNCALAGCAAIAGSTKLGRNCVLAGGAGLVGHIELCDDVTITGRAVITKSISEPGVYSSGTPFEENRQWRKNAVRISQLDNIARRLASLEKQKNL